MADEEEVDETLDADEGSYYGGGNLFLSIKRQLFCCSSSFLTMFCAAIAMHREFDILIPASHANGIAGAISIPFIGDIFGAVLAMVLLPLVGRKTSLTVSHVLFIVPSLGVIVGLDPKVEFYLVILLHLATRYFLVTFAIYFAEVTDRWLRGPAISSRYFLYEMGLMLATHAFDKNTTGCMIVVVLQIVSLAISLMLPETPYYLALTGNREDAEARFEWLRGGGADPDQMENMVSRAEMAAEIAAEEGLPFKKKTFLLPLLAVCCMELGVFGSIPLTYYGQTTIEHIYHFRPLIDYKETIFGANKFIVNEETLMVTMKLLGTMLIAAVPRRFLYLIVTFASMICCTSYMAASFNPETIYQVVTAYKFVVFLGGEQLAHVSSTEVFPGILRSFGVSLTQIFQTVVDWATLYALHVPENIDNFVLLAFGVIPLGFALSFIFVPETFNLTLEEAEDTGGYIAFRIFKGNLATEDEEYAAEE